MSSQLVSKTGGAVREMKMPTQKLRKLCELLTPVQSSQCNILYKIDGNNLSNGTINDCNTIMSIMLQSRFINDCNTDMSVSLQSRFTINEGEYDSRGNMVNQPRLVSKDYVVSSVKAKMTDKNDGAVNNNSILKSPERSSSQIASLQEAYDNCINLIKKLKEESVIDVSKLGKKDTMSNECKLVVNKSNKVSDEFISHDKKGKNITKTR